MDLHQQNAQQLTELFRLLEVNLLVSVEKAIGEMVVHMPCCRSLKYLPDPRWEILSFSRPVLSINLSF